MSGDLEWELLMLGGLMMIIVYTLLRIETHLKEIKRVYFHGKGEAGY
jgi:hypothetical protein